MKNQIKLPLAMILGLVAFGCASPKILTSSQFLGDSKVSKVLMKKTDKEAVKGEKLFDAFIQVCSLDTNNQEKDCKDTLVLPAVTPVSVY